MDRSRSAYRKYLDALRGGSSWTTSLERERACRARDAMKPWTAAVCSTFLSSCLLRLPETLRHSNGVSASMGATIHRLLAAPTEARSLRASIASPRSVTARRRRPLMAAYTARSRAVSRPTISESLDRFSPITAPSWSGVSHGQSEIRSRARFSTGLSRDGSIQSSPASGSRSAGRDARAGGSSSGQGPRTPVWSRTVRRSRSLAPEGVRQMDASAPAEAVSLSRAR